jgi:hypothetical protein
VELIEYILCFVCALLSVYRTLVGSLIFISRVCRPEIAYPAGDCARFISNPGTGHWHAALRVLRYLGGTMTSGIHYEGLTPDSGKVVELVGYSDADFARCPDTRRSTSGYVFMMCGGPVSWSSSRQQTVAKSSMEAEYVALSYSASEALALMNLMATVEYPVNRPVQIHEDNQSAISFAKYPKTLTRAKHIDIAVHFVREKIADGLLSVSYCPTNQMLADILTKPLPTPLFRRLTHTMGIRPLPLQIISE